MAARATGDGLATGDRLAAGDGLMLGLGDGRGKPGLGAAKTDAAGLGDGPTRAGSGVGGDAVI